MKSMNYAGKLKKMGLFIYVSIDLKEGSRIKEDIVFVMKAKSLTLNVHLEQTYS